MQHYIKATTLSIKYIPAEEKAWLAGFIDGEGFIGLTKQKTRESTKHAAGYHYHPYLIVTGTENHTIHNLNSITGCGHVITQTQKGNQKTAYQWKLTKYNDLLHILGQIQRHLRIKQKQCELIIQFITTRQQANIKTGRGSRGSTSFSENEEQIYQELRNLNKKGQ